MSIIKTIILLSSILLFYECTFKIDKSVADELRDNLLSNKEDGDNEFRKTEFEYNCYYLRAMVQKITEFLSEKEEDGNLYKRVDIVGKALYTLFYTGRKDLVDEKAIKKLRTELISLQADWGTVYKNEPNFPAYNLGRFFYQDKQYCIATSQMSLLLYMYLDNHLIDDKKAFLIKVLTTMYDGDEEIFNLFNRKAKVKYSEINHVDNTNAFKRFILYNYSILLNKSGSFIQRIQNKKESQKAEMIADFVDLYTYAIDKENLYAYNLEQDIKTHRIKAILNDINKAKCYFKIFFTEELLKYFAGLVKAPVVGELADEAVSKINKSMEDITLKYFDEKPKEFIEINKYITEMQNTKTNDILSLNLQYFDSYTTNFKCKTCSAYYDEHMLEF